MKTRQEQRQRDTSMGISAGVGGALGLVVGLLVVDGAPGRVFAVAIGLVTGALVEMLAARRHLR
jgi:outer membrane lipoprotein SlyB